MSNHGRKQGKDFKSEKPRGFKETGKKPVASKVDTKKNSNPTAKRTNSEELTGPNTKQQRSPVVRSPNPQPPNPNRTERPLNLQEALDAQRHAYPPFNPNADLGVENASYFANQRTNTNSPPTPLDLDDVLSIDAMLGTATEPPPSPMVVEKDARERFVPPSPMLVEKRASANEGGSEGGAGGGEELQPPPSPMCIDEKRSASQQQQPSYLVHPLRERKPPKPKSESAISTAFDGNAFAGIGSSKVDTSTVAAANGAALRPQQQQNPNPNPNQQHHPSNQHHYVPQYVRFPWYGIQVRSRFPVGALHTELLQFCQYIKPTQQELALRANVVEKLRPVVSKLWSQAQVNVFGSYDTKLFLPTRCVISFVSFRLFSFPHS
jgi:hypothetical protein